MNERGSALVKIIIAVVLLGSLIFTAIQIAPIVFLYQDHRNFQNDVETQVQSVSVSDPLDIKKTLTEEIIKMLDDMEAQYDQHYVQVNVEEEKKKIAVQVWYTRPHKSLFFPNPKLFYAYAEKTGITLKSIAKAQSSPPAPAKKTSVPKNTRKAQSPTPTPAKKFGRSKSIKELRDSFPVAVTDATFTREVLQSQIPVMVDFGAVWCGPCRQADPAVDEAARKFAGQIKIAKLNVDRNKKTTSRYGVRGIPTFIFFKNGKAVGRQSDFGGKQRLFDLIRKYI